MHSGLDAQSGFFAALVSHHNLATGGVSHIYGVRAAK